MNLDIALVFSGCCDKLTQTWWLETIEIYSFTVLEAKSMKSRCLQGCALFLFQVLVAVHIPWLVVTSSSIFTLSVFSSSICYKDTCHWI